MRVLLPLSTAAGLAFASGPAIGAPPPSGAQPVPAPLMEWTAPEPEFRVRKLGPKSWRIDVMDSGRLLKKGWGLVYRDKPVKVDDSGAFRIGASIPKPGRYQLRLSVVSPYGDVSKTTREVVMPEALWQRLIDEHESGMSGLAVLPGLGITRIEYLQTGFASYSATNLTAKVSLTTDIVPNRWVLVASAYGTVLTLSRPPEAALRFFGLNGRIGWRPSWPASPWRLTLSGGFYYTTTFVSAQDASSALGFINLTGLSVSPLLERRFESGDRIGFSIKYAPVTDRLSVLALSNRELAFGLSWTFARPGARVWNLGFDWADLQIQLGDSAISSKSTSLGVSVLF